MQNICQDLHIWYTISYNKLKIAVIRQDTGKQGNVKRYTLVAKM